MNNNDNHRDMLYVKESEAKTELNYMVSMYVIVDAAAAEWIHRHTAQGIRHMENEDVVNGKANILSSNDDDDDLMTSLNDRVLLRKHTHAPQPANA